MVRATKQLAAVAVAISVAASTTLLTILSATELASVVLVLYYLYELGHGTYFANLSFFISEMEVNVPILCYNEVKI